ncbi:peptidase S8 [Micromonospora zingiberis]|uniref:Peptidase S8 n=1 Tax=Micromonospora zingiberis TaxID=2053011 RepID=A0A4R0GNW2_9ACTN|nr:S8 family serine peptidase [Micromonospora zingiberis]TCB98382.1 peptidase S8 [Micromonospora zingiberis]
MRRLERVGAAGLAAALVLGVGQPGWAAPGAGGVPGGGGPGGNGGAPVAAEGQSATVTLITGDRITVDRGGRVTIRPAKDRASVRFRTHELDGELSVVPVDAVPLIASGVLDRRLFNVSKLIEYGYHDAARDRLPMIVAYPDGTAARRGGSPLPADEIRVDRELPAIEGAAVSADKGDLAEVWADLTGAEAGTADRVPGLERIWLDGKRRPAVDRGVRQIGAPAAYEAGFTGAGVTVAVIDSGVDLTHPDLADAVTEAVSFLPDNDPVDRFGHGTHVASTIAGRGTASGGRYRGVAPDAELVSAKVCEYWCDDSAILAAMHWAAVDKQATVINMSLGGWDGPEIDPMEEAVNTLTAQTGALFVVSAGNDGPGERTVGSPGSADAALTVGAVDRDGSLADFSSRGARIGDDAVKPDITAPGVGIVAAKAAEGEMGIPVDEHHVAESGTSMAAPHVAGAAALLAQQHPDWDATRLKATLMGSANPRPGDTAYQQGAGLVDVARAIGQSVTADPPSVSYGRTQWPHHDDDPITRTVTYRNDGAEPLTLDLAWQVIGPDGKAAPDGMFRTGAPQVTVPAGGTAEVAATVDTSVDGVDGYYSGHLVATAGQLRSVVPVGVHREVESYNLTVDHLDSTGAPADTYWTLVSGIDGPAVEAVDSTAAQATVRVPTGRYAVTGVVDEFGETERSSLLSRPEVDLTRDLTVTLDARKAKPITATVPDRTARPVLVQTGVIVDLFDGPPALIDIGADGFGSLYSAQLGGRATHEHLSGFVGHQWARPDGNGGFAGSPYIYHLGEGFPGRLPTGYRKDVRRAELATVRHEMRGERLGDLVERNMAAEFDGVYGATLSGSVPVGDTWTEHHSTKSTVWSGGISIWQSVDEEPGEEFRKVLFGEPQRYRAGRAYQDVWNAAPIGPTLLRTGTPFSSAGRIEDVIRVDIPLHGDAAGHGGISNADTGRTALYRDGELIDEYTEPLDAGFGFFEVPADAAAYRLETSSRRSYTELSTEVDLTWQFRSARPVGEDWVRLPVMVVRYDPKLDSNAAAPTGKRFDIPLRVLGNERATVTPKRVTTQVSYDDGKTWQPATVKTTGGNWTATVQHPRTGSYVSLRTSVTDRQGNTVDQTIIRAYRLSHR